jgi:hypothetical protein
MRADAICAESRSIAEIAKNGIGVIMQRSIDAPIGRERKRPYRAIDWIARHDLGSAAELVLMRFLRLAWTRSYRGTENESARRSVADRRSNAIERTNASGASEPTRE